MTQEQINAAVADLLVRVEKLEKKSNGKKSKE